MKGRRPSNDRRADAAIDAHTPDSTQRSGAGAEPSEPWVARRRGLKIHWGTAQQLGGSAAARLLVNIQSQHSWTRFLASKATVDLRHAVV